MHDQMYVRPEDAGDVIKNVITGACGGYLRIAGFRESEIGAMAMAAALTVASNGTLDINRYLTPITQSTEGPTTLGILMMIKARKCSAPGKPELVHIYYVLCVTTGKMITKDIVTISTCDTVVTTTAAKKCDAVAEGRGVFKSHPARAAYEIAAAKTVTTKSNHKMHEQHVQRLHYSEDTKNIMKNMALDSYKEILAKSAELRDGPQLVDVSVGLIEEVDA
jgi:hypothetical protein